MHTCSLWTQCHYKIICKGIVVDFYGSYIGQYIGHVTIPIIVMNIIIHSKWLIECEACVDTLGVNRLNCVFG